MTILEVSTISTAVPTDRGSRRIVLLILTPSLVIAALLVLLYFVAIPLWPVINTYYFPEQVQTYATYRLPLYLHIVAGAVALVLGAISISLRSRQSSRTHRAVGIGYTAAVAVSAPCAVVMAFHAYPGTLPGGQAIATSGFALLALAWGASLIRAVLAIRRGDRNAHRAWMIVNFSLTFAAVTLRLQNGVLIALGQQTFELLYPLLAYTCWVPNVLVAAAIVARVRRRTDAVTE